MRLKSSIWISAYLRRCRDEGAYPAIRQRGAEEAGAIFIKVSRLDGTADLYSPAPQSVFDEDKPIDRIFTRAVGETPVPEAKVEERLAQEMRFDPDIWIIEVEDRAGRHFIEKIV
jgi:hypothetical protein